MARQVARQGAGGEIWVKSGSESERRSVVSDSLRPPGLYSPWNSPGQNTGVGSLPLPRRSGWDLPNPVIKPRSPTLQADSLPAELTGKPKYAGVGAYLSLFQRIFPTQVSTRAYCLAGGFFTSCSQGNHEIQVPCGCLQTRHSELVVMAP